jgi:hypothetical protein
MRALRPAGGVIPRAFADSRSVDARRYRTYCAAMQAALGPLPAVALTTLREAGRASVELERLGADLDVARQPGRKKGRLEAARIRKAQFMLREQLGRLERRLEELAAGHRTLDPHTAIRDAMREANRVERA